MIKRYRGLSVPLFGSVAPGAEQRCAGSIRQREQGEEEDVDKGDHEHELEAVVPEPEARASQG